MISGLTIAGGISTTFGGGIYQELGTSILDLNDVVIAGNTAASAGGGGIAMGHGSFLSLKNSKLIGNTASGYGGGIDFLGGSGNNGSLFMDNSTLSGNTSDTGTSNGPGGGIYFGGVVSPTPPAGFTPSTLVIRNSVIDNNTTADDGGGIQLSTFTDSVLVQNTTISNNSAAGSGGGIETDGGSMTLQNCTVASNYSDATVTGTGGGGIARISSDPGSISLVSTIVSGNTNANAPDILRTSANTTVNANFSAIGSNVGFTLSGTSANNLAFGTNLKLLPLGNYGGQSRVMLPGLGSPLINAGSNPLALSTDQRGSGFARVVGGTIDIGAAESQDFLTVTNANDSGSGSLRSVLTQANGTGAFETIFFDPTVFNTPRTISLLTALPDITDAVTFAGPGASLLTVRRDPGAATAFRIFSSSAPILNIYGLTATGGNPTGTGGALNVPVTGSNVTLDGVLFTGNAPFMGGGAVAMPSGGLLTVRNSSLSNNAATFGGAIDIYSGDFSSLVIDNSTLSGNMATSSASDAGGGVYFGNSANPTPPAGFVPAALLIRNSTIDHNSSASSGGGIVVDNLAGTLILRNSTLVANSAAGSGGAVYQDTGTGSITVQNSTITGNSASGGRRRRRHRTPQWQHRRDQRRRLDHLGQLQRQRTGHFPRLAQHDRQRQLQRDWQQHRIFLLRRQRQQHRCRNQSPAEPAGRQRWPDADHRAAGGEPRLRCGLQRTDRSGTVFRPARTGIQPNLRRGRRYRRGRDSADELPGHQHKRHWPGQPAAAVNAANASGANDTIAFDTAGVFATPQTISLLTALPDFASGGGGLAIPGTGSAKLTIQRDPARAPSRSSGRLPPR